MDFTSIVVGLVGIVGLVVIFGFEEENKRLKAERSRLWGRITTLEQELEALKSKR